MAITSLFPRDRRHQVFQSHRVQRAFKLLKRVVTRKGEDIAAALLIMFISLIFIATVMYVIEGNSHEVSSMHFSADSHHPVPKPRPHLFPNPKPKFYRPLLPEPQGFDSFDSIPVSIYWGGHHPHHNRLR